MRISTRLRRMGALSVASLLAAAGLVTGGVGANPADAATTSTATTQWGVKASFVNYIKRGPAQGEIATSGDVSDAPAAFTWVNGKGEVDEAAKTADVQHAGQIHFTGHGGILDTKLSNLRIVLHGETGKVYLDAASNDPDGKPAVDQAGVEFLALKEVTWNGTSVTAKTTLTKEGAVAFGGFYEEGKELDPISVQLPVDPEPAVDPSPEDSNGSTTPANGETQIPETSAPAPQQQPAESNDQVSKPDNDAPRNNMPGAPEENRKNDTGKGPATSEPRKTDPVGKVADQETCVAQEVTGTLEWGVRQSFRNYISGGIAKGKWELAGGAAESGAGFTWGSGSGEVNSKDIVGVVNFPGSVHFTGHKGVLDFKISNVRIVLEGTDSGALVADLDYSNMDGKKFSTENLRFAELSYAVNASGNSLSITDATVTLTANGATAFAGFYEPGTVLDPISMTLSLGDQVACSDTTASAESAGSTAAGDNGKGGKKDKLAETGAEAFAPLGALSTLLLLAGVGLMVVNQRIDTSDPVYTEQ